MFTVWAQSLSNSSLVMQIEKRAQRAYLDPTHFPSRAAYRALAREANTRGFKYPVYPSQTELRFIAFR